MTKTASIASSAGMEFETTAAFLSQIIETTRESAETAGTAMKTIVARFQELKKAPSEIGEVEGEIVDANQIETALRSVGIALRDSSGQFRDLDDVFLELAQRWDTLDTNTRRYIATIAAGSRQQSRFIAMMSDYERTQELVNAANSSAGASNKQFEKTLDSLESKVAKLKNAWHEFTMGIVNNELVKFGVDALTKMLEIINKATSALGSWGNSLTKIIGVLAIFKMGKKLFDQFQKPIFDLFSSIAVEAGNKGYESGKNFATEAERGAKEAMSGQPAEKDEKEKQPTEKSGFFGYKAFGRAMEYHTQEKEARDILNSADYQSAGNELKKLEEQYTFTRNKDGSLRVHQKGVKSGKVDKDKDLEDLKKQYQDLTDKADKYAKAEGALKTASTEKWSAITQGISTAGAAITGTGVALSTLGGILSSLGLEETGETLSQIGQVIILVGGAVSALVPIIQLVQAVASAAGIAISAAFGWVTLAVAAVVALGFAIFAVADAIEKSSPEGKLKAAKEEAEQAAKAAGEATESYNNLKDSLANLEDEYSGLEKLTRGTEEWNEAVQNINNEIMDLIQKYPQLAEFLKTEGGVLTLDVDDARVQEVVIQAQTVAIATQNASQRAEKNVTRAQKVKDFGESAGIVALAEKKREETTLQSVAGGALIGAKFGEMFLPGVLSIPGAIAGGVTGALAGLVFGSTAGEEAANEIKTDEGLQENVAKAAKSLSIEGKEVNYDNLLSAFQGEGIEEADAKILAKAYAQDTEGFIKLQKELVEYDKAISNFSAAMAESAKGLVKIPEELANDFEGQNQFWNVLDAVLDADDYERFYEEEQKKFETGETSITEEDRQRFVEQIGGKNATLEGTKIVSSSGTTIVDNADDEYFQSLLAEEKATERFSTAGATAYEFLQKAKNFIPDHVASDNLIERLFSDKNGGELYRGEAEAIKKIDASTLFANLTKEEQELFGSAEGLKDYLNNAAKKAEEAFSNSKSFEGITARAATNLTNVINATGMSNPDEFVAKFNQAMLANNASEGDKQIFKQLVSSITPEQASQREVWEQIATNLEAQGVELIAEMRDFFDTALRETEAIYSSSWLEEMGVSGNLISYYQRAIDSEDAEMIEKFHNTFKKWRQDYNATNNTSKKTEHELITQVADRLVENLDKQIEQQEELVDAVGEVGERLLDKIQKQIDESRKARENEESEKKIKDMYSQLAYLSADTSGASVLEQISLQEEIAEAEQDYRDSLIDQALQELSDANELAAEQRERQIELARMQLDAYQDSSKIYNEAKDILEQTKDQVANGVPIEETTIGKLYEGKSFASDWERAEFWSSLAAAISEILPEASKNGDGGDNPKTPYLKGGGSRGIGLSTVTQVIMDEMEWHAPRFATGGVADFTGPAWLDGTKSDPEIVLNQRDSANFIILKDILGEILNGASAVSNSNTKQNSGDNHFDIDINVEKIDNDYDVEQVANKIRRMIYDDASYRNVNAVGLM